jgi:hypothetical protein
MQASVMIKLQISHIEIRSQVYTFPVEHSDPLTISDLCNMVVLKCIKYIFAKKTSKLENFGVSSKNFLTDIHLKHFSTLLAKKSCFSPQVNFPQDEGNILSI